MHPSSLLTRFIHFIERNFALNRHQPVLLAVSGGMDSVVMADLFYKAGIPFAIIHCNFNLRGSESDQDEIFVRDLARKYNVPEFAKHFDTKDFAERNKLSVQMAARELRYQWFEEIRLTNDFQFIATAHHLDDQTETFLLNLIRGTGIAGLHGIPVRNGNIIRPLMFAYRNDIEDYAKQNDIQFRMDSSNNELKYTRNKIRNRLIPLIREINPQFTEKIHGTISHLAESEQINQYVFNVWRKQCTRVKDDRLTVNLKKIKELPVLSPFLWEIISSYGFSETQLYNLVDSLDSRESAIFYSGDYRMVKDRNSIVIEPKKSTRDDDELQISHFEDSKVIHNPIHLVLRKFSKPEDFAVSTTTETVTLDASKITFPLILRKWRDGDSFQPFGMRGKKKVSDYLTDLKIPFTVKENTYILCSGRKIVWVVGLRPDERFRVTGKTTDILEIKFAKFAK